MDPEWQFPFAFSAIHGDPEVMEPYRNFKNFYSIILLSLVDLKYCFIWGSVGAAGISHDSTIFQSISLWKNKQLVVSSLN